MLGKFGKYTLIEKLAEGGMAEVFKATVKGSDGHDRAIAIKRLHRHFSEDPELTQMLVDEARIAVRLNHPNIAQVFDLGRLDNQCFIVMEYIDGPDVQFVSDRAREFGEYLPVPAVLLVVSDTLAALHYAHSKTSVDGQSMGIVHRDVSPQNVMIAQNGQIKLVDFGIAKAKSRAQTTQHGIIKGKFYYMSPEQAHGHHVDPRSDVYAAGMVLYELLVGRSPYEDVPEPELLKQVRMSDFPPPTAYRSDLDPELSRLVMQAVERNPNHRYANAMEFQLAINDYRQRRCPPFQYRQLAEMVARYVDDRPSPDPYDPMVRQVYRASTESMLFEKPEDSALVLKSQDISFLSYEQAGVSGAAGGGENPFSEDAPTEVYDKKPVYAEPPRQHQLPPSPHGGPAVVPDEQPQFPRQERVSGSAGTSERPGPGPRSGRPAATVGALPSNAPAANQRKPGKDTRKSTQHALIDTFAKPVYVYAALLLAVVLVVALAVVWAMQPGGGAEGLAAAESPSAASGEGRADGPTVAVAFESKPSNAVVYIDDVEEGTTPLSVDLDVGKTYQIEILKDGYDTFEREIKAQKDTEEVSAELEQAAGIVKVMSFPPDAQVTIEGQQEGKTPVTIAGLETDEKYKIVARLGDDEREEIVSWDADTDDPIKEVMFEFEEAPADAKLSLNIDDEKKSASSRRTYRRTRAKRKRTRRKKRKRRKPPEPKQEEEVEEDLDLWGGGDDSASTSESSSDEKEDDDDSFSVWGSDDEGATEPKKKDARKKTQKKKTKRKKKDKKKKKEKKEKNEDDDFDIW